MRSASSTISSSRPKARASWALIRADSMTRRIALWPASRGSSTLAALEMVSPMLFSGRKYSAAGVPIRVSKHKVISQAPPTAIPLRAATVGTRVSSAARVMSWNSSTSADQAARWQRCRRVQVLAGRERAAGAGEHDPSHRVAAAEVTENRGKFPAHPGGERVEFLRPGERDHGDGLLYGHVDVAGFGAPGSHCVLPAFLSFVHSYPCVRCDVEDARPLVAVPFEELALLDPRRRRHGEGSALSLRTVRRLTATAALATDAVSADVPMRLRKRSSGQIFCGLLSWRTRCSHRSFDGAPRSRLGIVQPSCR